MVTDAYVLVLPRKERIQRCQTCGFVKITCQKASEARLRCNHISNDVFERGSLSLDLFSNYLVFQLIVRSKNANVQNQQVQP